MPSLCNGGEACKGVPSEGVNRLMMVLSLVLFISFTVNCYAESTSKYDTPFTIEWRKRYEANNVMQQFVVGIGVRECREKCSKKDIAAIKKLAKQGDKFALAFYPYFSLPEMNISEAVKMAADNGEPHHATIYGALKNENYDLAKKYLHSAVEQDAFAGYNTLLMLYAKYNKKSEYCELLDKAYKKFGFELIGTLFIYADLTPNEQANKLIMQCFNKTEPEIFAMHGNEGQLVQGYKYVYEKKYNEAYSIFEKLYIHGDSSKISANAGYCLGMMNYYGVGTKKAIEKGRILLKEAFDNGVVYPNTPEQKGMPEKYEIISHGNGTCNYIK